MKIVITGTPGCGKSTLAKLLASKFNYELFSLSQIAKDNSLVDKKSEVDLKKLSKSLSFLKNKKDRSVFRVKKVCVQVECLLQEALIKNELSKSYSLFIHRDFHNHAILRRASHEYLLFLE